MSKKKNSQEEILTLCGIAILCAMQVALEGVLSIPIGNDLKLQFSFITVAVAAHRFGMGASVLVCALGDFIGAMLPSAGSSGPYLPGFTITAAMTGLIYGLFLQKKGGPVRIVLAVLTSQIVCSFLMNSLWVHHYFGAPLGVLLVKRGVQAAFTGVIAIIFLLLFLEKICRVIKTTGRGH